MTSSIVADTLPNFIAIKSNHYSDKGHVYYEEGGPVLLGEPSVFSTLVKIEVEPAADNKYHFSLRFSYTNRYWSRSSSAAGNKSVVAESDQPEEDTTKASCTLFEATAVGDSGTFYLTHVNSGGRVVFHQGASATATAMALYVEENFEEEQGYLTLVDWGTLVKLPAHVAIKGSNGKYLQPSVASLSFTGDDPNAVGTSFAVYPMDDGYVRIRMYDGAMFCGMQNSSSDYINLLLHSDSDNELTHFWPVKIDDESTIALRTKIGGRFCDCHKSESGIFYLGSASTSIIQDARLLVEELVLERKVYNVRYQMEYARIFDEAPYVAGSGTLTNDGDEVAALDVSITYQDSKSSTFSRSTTLKVGVKTSITCGFPFIAEGKVEVSAEVGTTLTWGTTTTETKTVTAKGSVPVPAKSRAVVDYVGTKGTCNIPFSYVQEDQRSTDGGTERVEEVDGIFTGVNCYNFDFHVRKVEALA